MTAGDGVWLVLVIRPRMEQGVDQRGVGAIGGPVGFRGSIAGPPRYGTLLLDSSSDKMRHGLVGRDWRMVSHRVASSFLTFRPNVPQR